MKSVFGHNFLITSSPAYINNFQTVTDIVVILFRLSKDRFRLFKSKINLRMVEVWEKIITISSPVYVNNFQTVTYIVVILFRLSKDRFRLFR